MKALFWIFAAVVAVSVMIKSGFGAAALIVIIAAFLAPFLDRA